MENLTITNEQRLAARQLSLAGGRFPTGKALAGFRMAKDAAGHYLHPRYKDIPQATRIAWLGDQLFALSLLAHQNITALGAAIDASALDAFIMEDANLRVFTLEEIQEAFLQGVRREYGDYFGLSAVSLHGFLKGYLRSEKRVEAANIIFRQAEREQLAADGRFFRELKRAQAEGLIDVPEFGAILKKV